MKSINRKFFIQTYGCQANIADSESISSILRSLGFSEAVAIEESDIFVINSCSVRQKSEDKVYGLGRKMLDLEKSRKGKPFTILAGCMVGSVTGERTRDSFRVLKKKTSWVDLYLSPDSIGDLSNLMRNVFPDIKGTGNPEKEDTNLENTRVFCEHSRDKIDHAYVNISTGCDNFCTYCVVPFARGPEKSRLREEILKETYSLIGKGVTKITLCGQNVNSWGISREEKQKLRTGGNQQIPFASLLREIHDIDQIKEIDFISSNPFDFTQDLINIFRLPKIANYIHVAVQSGNNEVLKKMNRRHTAEEYLALISEIRKVRPNIEIGTDVIVGFPSETREQFMDTVKLFEQVKFSVAFISMYSPRKGTAAEIGFKDDVPLKEKRWRHKYLTNVWKENKPNG